LIHKILKCSPQDNRSVWNVVELSLWSDEQVETYIKTRIEMFESALGGFITDCTSDEKWERVDKKGKMTRMHCEHYCSMAGICPSNQEFLKGV